MNEEEGTQTEFAAGGGKELGPQSSLYNTDSVEGSFILMQDTTISRYISAVKAGSSGDCYRRSREFSRTELLGMAVGNFMLVRRSRIFVWLAVAISGLLLVYRTLRPDDSQIYVDLVTSGLQAIASLSHHPPQIPPRISIIVIWEGPSELSAAFPLSHSIGMKDHTEPI